MMMLKTYKAFAFRNYECVCNAGYESTETGNACRDVDECRDTPNVCRRGRCRNTPGSYDCQCDAGFQFVPGGYCTDIDECADKSVCQVSYYDTEVLSHVPTYLCTILS